MLDPKLAAFTLAVGMLTLIPGADTMLVMRSVLGRGRTAGFLTALGIGSGLFVQALLSGLGLSAILARSAQLYSAVKLVGALYLVGLGAWTLLVAWRGGAHGSDRSTASPAPSTGERQAGLAYFEGLLTNVLNPKVAVFYLAFLPQFIGPGEPVLAKSMLLAGIHFVLTIGWLSALTLVLGRVSGWISRPAVKRRLDSVAGVLLVAFGARLALDRS